MTRWTRYWFPISVAVLVGLVAVLLLPPPAAPTITGEAPTPTRDWAKCIARDPRACTTVNGVALGLYEGPMSLAVKPCDLCQDALGTARSALERRALGHPQVAAIDLFAPDQHVFCGDIGPCSCSCLVGIYVFTFSDATTFPIVVYCGIGNCTAMDHYGPPNPPRPL